MIISLKYGLVIATPTQCGSSSLETLFRRKVPGTISTSSPHVMDPPHKFNRFKRVMLVRNPYDRLLSAYKYTRRKKYGPMLKMADGTFGKFLNEFIELQTIADRSGPVDRHPLMHILSLKELAAIYQPQEVWHLEDLRGILDRLGVKEPLPYINKNPEGVIVTHKDLSMMNRIYCYGDARQFGYRVQE